MPLADIFIGAIACLLILIIVARQSQVAISHIPQADIIITCPPSSSDPRQDEQHVQPVLVATTELVEPAPVQASASLEQFLRQTSVSSRLSTRILLQAEPKQTKCIRKVRYLVKRLNQQYETPGTKKRPKSYLILDIDFSFLHENFENDRRQYK